MRGYVPEVRDGLRKLIWELKILEGRCVNAAEACRLNIQYVSRPISSAEITKAETLINEGLAMIEGLG